MNRVILKASTVLGGGRGAFATRDFCKGEVVCFYDGEDVDPLKESSKAKLVEAHQHGMNFFMSNRMIRLGSPVVRHPAGVAQFINDGATLNFDDVPKVSPLQIFDKFKMLEKVKKYLEISDARCNVSQSDQAGAQPPCLAEKEIKAGEELFMSYGSPYWVTCAINNMLQNDAQSNPYQYIQLRNIQGVALNHQATWECLVERFDVEKIPNLISFWGRMGVTHPVAKVKLMTALIFVTEAKASNPN